jgi:hypothetical protein
LIDELSAAIIGLVRQEVLSRIPDTEGFATGNQHLEVFDDLQLHRPGETGACSVFCGNPCGRRSRLGVLTGGDLVQGPDRFVERVRRSVGVFDRVGELVDARGDLLQRHQNLLERSNLL